MCICKDLLQLSTMFGSIQQPICPINNQDPYSANKWCTYQAIDNYTITIQIIYLVILGIMSFAIFTYFIRLIRYRNDARYFEYFGDVFVQVFVFVILWLISSIIRVSLNIAIYYTYMAQDFLPSQLLHLIPWNQQEISQNLVVSASVNTFFDFICSFLINLLILLIPYQWIKILLLSTNQQQIVDYISRKKISTFFIVLDLIKIYYKYIRLVYLLLLIMQPFLFFLTRVGRCQMPMFNYIFVVCQSGMIILFYLFGAFVSHFMKKNNLIKMSIRDQRRIKIQYFCLLTVLIFRIILNLVFKISPFDFYDYNPNSHCADTGEQNKIKASIFLSLHHCFMHILPIIVILYIYYPNIDQRKKDQIQLLMSQHVDRSLRTQQQLPYSTYNELQKKFYRSSFDHDIKKMIQRKQIFPNTGQVEN